MAQEYKGPARSYRNPVSTRLRMIRRTPTCRTRFTVIKGRRFPTCRHCKGIRFELAHAAKHVGQIDHLEEAHAAVG